MKKFVLTTPYLNRYLLTHWCSYLACVVSALLLNATDASAATLTVTNGNDSGPGSLRQAILDASPSGGDTINFAAGVTTVVLTSGELLINKNLTILGPGPNVLTVERAAIGDFRIFHIPDLALTVSISGLKITNGYAPFYLDGRAGSDSGGGVANIGSTLTIVNCTISNNRSDYNAFWSRGGAGVYNSGVLSITNSTVSGNSSAGYGGGILNDNRMTITNCTISSNTTSNGFYNGGGGGINNLGGAALTITNSTIAGNSSYSPGGGYYSGDSSELVVRNTIIASNTSNSAQGKDVAGVLISQGFNLIGDGTGAIIAPTQSSDQIGTTSSPIDPLLGPLQNNGGPTFTRALRPGSRAIDQGHSSGSSTDQRGVQRPIDQAAIANAGGGDGSDIGAFEFDGIAVPPRGDFNGDGKPDYLLYNAATRQTAVWYMNNNVFVSGAFSRTISAGWNLVDVSDFNGDGHPDFALFNPSTRQTVIWYMSGAAFLGGVSGPTLPSGWQLVFTSDFNRDGKPDFALFNPGIRQTAVWYMNNNVLVSGAYGPTLPSGWRGVGIADFNGDGNSDVLLFNPSTRQSAIWYLSGVTFIGSVYGPTIASGYVLTGAADFNRDGNPDYALYNPSTRRTAIWYLNNNVFVSGAYGPTLTAGWSLVAP